MNNRKDKWNKVTAEVIEAIDNIKTLDEDEKIMLFNIMYNLNKILKSEEQFNDSIEILRKYKPLKYVDDNKSMIYIKRGN